MTATSKWIALALLGLAIAAGVAFTATRLVSEQIGIASEPVSVGYELAPAVRSTAPPARADDNGGTRTDDRTDTAAEPTPSEEPAPSGGDEGPGAKEREDREDEIRDAEEDRAKEQEDALEDAAKEQEDREDEIRDAEEDRRDD